MKSDPGRQEAADHVQVPELDGVRGLAIALVFVFHCMPYTGWRQVDAILALKNSLWIGVDLFFVLSGFLISGILIDRHQSPNRFAAFYARRTLRIFPLYYFALLLVYGGLSLNPTLASTLRGTAGAGWFAGYGFNVWIALQGAWPQSELLNHFWSLCVEEQFYVFWPFAVYSLRVTWFPKLAVVTLVAAVLLKVTMVGSGASQVAAFVSMPTRMDAFALGGLAAFASRFWDVQLIARVATWLLGVSSIGVAIVALPHRCLAFDIPSTIFPGSTLVAVFFASFIFLCVHPPPAWKWMQKLMRARFLRILGRYSYGIYVYHWLIQYSIVRLDILGWKQHPSWLVFLSVILFTAASAFVSYHLVEQPFLRLKHLASFARSR